MKVLTMRRQGVNFAQFRTNKQSWRPDERYMLYIPFKNQGKFLCIYGSRRGMIAKKMREKK